MARHQHLLTFMYSMAVVVQTVIELSKKKFENNKQREREKKNDFMYCRIEKKSQQL